ncbi:hypothetical protein BC940DRAFT_307979 [Gongronella butleri]|nr:hypothetical protein BC940DRAFT_307979 [Gongronella butleri]
MALFSPPTPPHHTTSPLQRLVRKPSEKWFFPLRMHSKRANNTACNTTPNAVQPAFARARADNLGPPLLPIHTTTYAELSKTSSSTQLIHKDANDIKRSQSFAYGTTIQPMESRRGSSGASLVYAAMLSRVAIEFQRQITVMDRCKDGIEYKNTFTGKEAVDCLAMILATGDRFLAMMVGRALGAQRFFHDVHYEQRLMDADGELYQLDVMIINAKQDFPDSPTMLLSPTVTESSAGSIADIDMMERPFPNGVMTELAHCYSPTCYGALPCYSATCPKRPAHTKRHVTYHAPLRSQQQQHHPLWADHVSAAEYNAISRNERKRQEHIFELIYTENNYVKDLEYLNEMWIEPLSYNQVIPESRCPLFLERVFANVLDIYAVNSRLISALLNRQKESTIVHAIGDIMLDFVVDFEPYVYYGARQHEAKHALEQERAINPDFDRFTNQTERHPRSKKLELNGYLTKPTTRLGRYSLLLGEILKRTPPNHPDHDNISKTIDTIKQFLIRVNAQAGRMKNRFDLEQLHQHLTFKSKSDVINLDLLKEGRVLLKEGILRKSASTDSTEYHVILLDHYVLITKTKLSRGGTVRYVVQYPPMALDLLTVMAPKESRDELPLSPLLSPPPPLMSIPQHPHHPFQPHSAAIGPPPPPLRPSFPHTPLLDTQEKRSSSSSILPYVNVNSAASPMLLRTYNSTSDMSAMEHASASSSSLPFDRKPGYPIVFDYLGRRSKNNFLVLYAPSEATRKPWIDKIIKQQQERHQRTKPIFRVLSAVEPGRFDTSCQSINHIISFNHGQQYILGTDHGVYVGHTSGKKTPHKILALPKVTQVQVIESMQLLLVLSERTLWEYPLDAVNNKPALQPQGKRVQTHVPFFYVGQSLQRTLVCVPKVSTLKSTITIYEPDTTTAPQPAAPPATAPGTTTSTNNAASAQPMAVTMPSSARNASKTASLQKTRAFRPDRPPIERKKSLLNRMPLINRHTSAHSDLHLKRLKELYIPSEVWAIELSPTKMLITSPRGMILVDMKSDKPQQLLDPADRHLTFVTEREREDLSQIGQRLKHIAIFRTPRGDHFVCYDEYGFYIDSKGNRLYPKFLIEWEGNPESFACQYPYIIAFDPSFIEIRHIITGELEQVIRGSHIRCLNNGYKTDMPLIFGVMADERQHPVIFQLQLIAKRSQSRVMA